MNLIGDGAQSESNRNDFKIINRTQESFQQQVNSRCGNRMSEIRSWENQSS